MSEKLNGGELVRAWRPHDCPCPSIQDNRIEPGDRWTCGACGSVWECEDMHDPRPGESGPYWACKSRNLSWGR